MARLAKVGIVVGGYVAAVIAAVIAAQLYNARMAAMPYDTSGGMYAGGEAITSLAVFLMVALVPTLLALWFLRGNERFWNTVAVASLVFAVVGFVAVLSPMVLQNATRSIAGLIMELVRVSHLLGAPFWFVAFVLFAFLAPSRLARRTLVAAIGVEFVTGVCVAVHWFLPRPPW